MNIIAVIPARGGSKRLPGKNIKLLNGRPLISYAISLAKEARQRGLISGHIVSTDDEKIAALAKRLGGNCPFLRPERLARDDSPTVEAIIHAVKWWEGVHGDKVHSTLLLQPTNPLTIIEDISGALKLYIKNQPEAACLIAACEADHVRPETLYRREGDYLRQVEKQSNPVTPSRRSRKIYWRNGAIYITRRDLLFSGNKLISPTPLLYEMPRSRSVPIDDMFDHLIAQTMLMNRK